jgi:hypothetical protein
MIAIYQAQYNYIFTEQMSNHHLSNKSLYHGHNFFVTALVSSGPKRQTNSPAPTGFIRLKLLIAKAQFINQK